MTRAARLALPLLLLVVAALGAVYAVVTPLFEVSDELWHYPMVKTLADGNGLPVQDPANVGAWRQEGSQPPLYYMLMAAATAWIDTRDLDQVRWINPHADNGVITPDGNNNILIHTARENWPWRGTVLAVRLIRLLSVLLSVGSVYFIYLFALELAPGRPAEALAAAALAGFTPMFLFISASVNNDTLAVLCSSAALWLLARWLRRPPQRLSWEPFALALALGAGALSKQSALGLFPLAAVVIVYATLRPLGWRPAAWRARLVPLARDLALVLGLAGLIAFWWYWRNFQLYGDWLGWNQFIAIVGRRPRPATLAQLWGERVGFMQAYWGLFGGVSVPLPGWVYTILNVFSGLALVGLAGQIATARRPWKDWAIWLLPPAWLIVILAALARWSSQTWASQGRLIFPALAAMGVLLAFGLARLWRGLPGLMALAMFGVAAAAPWTVIRPQYAPPPVLSAAQIAAISQPLAADFGGELKLLGYDLEGGELRPGGAVRLRLYWQSQTAMDRNWSVFVHLVDEYGLVIAQRDRYPGQGALATSQLTLGQTWVEECDINVPSGAYAPARLQVVVGVYDLADGYRLPLAGGGDQVTLAGLDLLARPGKFPNGARHNFEGQLELVGYDVDRRQARPGETILLTLYWRGLRPMPVNYSVFAHVRAPGEQTLWAGSDAWPQGGGAPTSTWAPGALIIDQHALTLKPDTPPGAYDLEVGVYAPETLARLHLVENDGRPTDADFIYLSRLRVLP